MTCRRELVLSIVPARLAQRRLPLAPRSFSLDDPESLNRVQVRLIAFDAIADQDAPLWARVVAPFAGQNRGAFFMPDVDDEVLVLFTNGDTRFPLVIGGLWNGASDGACRSRAGRQPLQADPLEERHHHHARRSAGPGNADPAKRPAGRR